MEIDTKQLWRSLLENVKVSVSAPVFNTWFSQTHLVNLKKDNQRYVAEIGCNNVFVKNTIENRYFGLIQDVLSSSLELPCELLFVIKENPDQRKNGLSLTPLFEEPTVKSQEITNIARNVGLRPGFTFANFAVSSSNQMAHAAAEAVANDLSGAYNPLFIWGGVGVGKTHLMHAVGYSVIEKDQETKLYCCTGEQFTNDIVEGIRNKTTSAVRQKYRKLKALLLDDIQFIAGKEGIQEEFFHTFNALVSSGGQVILTSDRPPSEISKLEERLKSRFEAGLIVDIAPPDFELRCAITQIKAKEKGVELAMDMAQTIAGNLESARKIEGFLIKLFSEARIKNVEITPEFIESQLGKGGETNGQILKKSSPNDVISAVSKHFSLNKKSLLGASRSRPVARPRQVLMYILRIDLGLPLEEVGRIVGRDHTTVMHAVNKITHMVSSDVNIREDIRGIKNML